MTYRHRRRRRYGAVLDYESVAVVAAWAPDADTIADARQMTHDGVLRRLGERRAGPVRWMESRGDEAEGVLEVLEEAAAEDVLAGYRRIRDLLAKHGGFLVLAMAPERSE